MSNQKRPLEIGRKTELDEETTVHLDNDGNVVLRQHDDLILLSPEAIRNLVQWMVNN